MIKRKVISLLILISSSLCANDDDELLGFSIEEQKYQVSIYTIAANQGDFHSKPVYLSGYLKFEYGTFNIYPDKCSCVDSFRENSISVGVTVNELDEYSKKYENCEANHVYGTYQRLNIYPKDGLQDLSLGHLNGEIKIFER
jgi:hypothetical protein